LSRRDDNNDRDDEGEVEDNNYYCYFIFLRIIVSNKIFTGMLFDSMTICKVSQHSDHWT